MNIYFDTEFTGLVPNTTLISLGCITEYGEKFYAEFTDYNKDLVDDWVKENVIKNLYLEEDLVRAWFEDTMLVKGDSSYIKIQFLQWLERVSKANYEKFSDMLIVTSGERVQFISDVCHYDFYLLCNQVFGGAFNLPSNVNPVCYDICQDLLNCFHTIDAMSGFPKDLATEMQKCFDISREEVCKRVFQKLPEGKKHNSLYDAEVIKLIYEGMRR